MRSRRRRHTLVQRNWTQEEGRGRDSVECGAHRILRAQLGRRDRVVARARAMRVPQFRRTDRCVLGERDPATRGSIGIWSDGPRARERGSVAASAGRDGLTRCAEVDTQRCQPPGSPSPPSTPPIRQVSPRPMSRIVVSALSSPISKRPGNRTGTRSRVSRRNEARGSLRGPRLIGRMIRADGSVDSGPALGVSPRILAWALSPWLQRPPR